jgi:hypothetical protein
VFYHKTNNVTLQSAIPMANAYVWHGLVKNSPAGATGADEIQNWWYYEHSDGRTWKVANRCVCVCVTINKNYSTVGFSRWCTKDPQYGTVARCGSVYLGQTVALRVATSLAANLYATFTAYIGNTDVIGCAGSLTYFCEYRMF